MQPHEQELLIARIMSGYVRHILSSNLTLVVKTPTVDQSYIAQEVFHETYELAKDNEIFTSEDVLNIMIECDMWDTMDSKREKQIPKDIENIKVEMFNAAFKLEEREAKRRILRKMEEQFFKVKSKKGLLGTAIDPLPNNFFKASNPVRFDSWLLYTSLTIS